MAQRPSAPALGRVLWDLITKPIQRRLAKGGGESGSQASSP